MSESAEFVETEIKGSPLNEALDDAAYQAILQEAERRFAHYRNGAEEVALPIGTNLVTALKSS